MAESPNLQTVLSDDERELIEKAAVRKSMTLPEFMRSAIYSSLEQPVVKINSSRRKIFAFKVDGRLFARAASKARACGTSTSDWIRRAALEAAGK